MFVPPAPSQPVLRLVRPPCIARSERESKRPGNAELWAQQFTSQDSNSETIPSLEDAWREAEAEQLQGSQAYYILEVFHCRIYWFCLGDVSEAYDDIFGRLEREWRDVLSGYEKERNEQFDQLHSSWQDEPLSFTPFDSGTEPLRYFFHEENPFHGVEDALTKGIERYICFIFQFARSYVRIDGHRLKLGDIANAVLLLEEAVRQSEDRKEEAWFYLGLAQSENENDEAAIKALTSVLRRNPCNLEALMALSASYTNEGDMAKAVQTLEDWLRLNPEYSEVAAHLPSSSTTESPTDSIRSFSSLFMFHTRAEQLLSGFQRAAERNPRDLNVLTAIAVLNCVRNDYKTAAEVFRFHFAIKSLN